MKLDSTFRQTGNGTFVTIKGSNSNVTLIGIGKDTPDFPKAVMVETERAVEFANRLVDLLNEFEV